MSDSLAAWLAGGHVVDVAIAVIVLEAVALSAYRRNTGRGLAPRDYLANLLAGLLLMLALRVALAAAPWPWIALALLGAGVAHAVDLRARQGRT